MQLLTIFNYPDELKYNVMCRTWLAQARKHCGNLDIVILTAQPLNDSLAAAIGDDPRVSVEICQSTDFPHLKIPQKKAHNIEFKMWNLSRRQEPYIWVDADAFILADLDFLVSHSSDKPWIGICHQMDIPVFTAHIRTPFLNGGVQIVSDPEFVDFDKIMAHWADVDGQFSVPGAEQAALHGYFTAIGYDYTHPLIGTAWNSCAGYTDFRPDFTAYRNDLADAPAVAINHYWEIFRPWDIDCPLYAREAAEMGGEKFRFAIQETSARLKRKAMRSKLQTMIDDVIGQAQSDSG